MQFVLILQILQKCNINLTKSEEVASVTRKKIVWFRLSFFLYILMLIFNWCNGELIFYKVVDINTVIDFLVKDRFKTVDKNKEVKMKKRKVNKNGANPCDCNTHKYL